MSLGLNDLKKKSPAKSSPAKTENWARTSRTARPWTSNELSKGPKARRTRETDAAMSIEWATDHTDALRAFDMETQTAVMQLQDLKMTLKEQAVELERKIKRAALAPLYRIWNLLER